MSEYRFTNSYKSLEICSSDWFSMSSAQREKHLILKGFLKSPELIEYTSPCVTDMQNSTEIKDLSVTFETLGIAYFLI